MAEFECDCRDCIESSESKAALLAIYKEDPAQMDFLGIIAKSRPHKKDVLPLFEFAAAEAAEYVTLVDCRKNAIDDDVGVKVAELIEKSEVLESVYINGNRLTNKTLIAIFQALQVNTSVKELFVHNNWFCMTPQIKELLTFALWINPMRPVDFKFSFYRDYGDEFILDRAREEVANRGHPSLQMILAVYDRKMTVSRRNPFAPVRRIQ
ncbi:MAG: hypothetical protein ACOVQN_04105 [Exiguobacterium sp.]